MQKEEEEEAITKVALIMGRVWMGVVEGFDCFVPLSRERVG